MTCPEYRQLLALLLVYLAALDGGKRWQQIEAERELRRFVSEH